MQKMELESFSPVSTVAVCGGTHGNELTGVYVVREMQKQKVEKVGLTSVDVVLTNPRAVALGRRYAEMDLNRCFSDAHLSSPLTESSVYEVRRAQELNAQLGPKGSEAAVDLLIDLHNTTANMGVCLLFYSIDWLTLHIYRYIKNKMSPLPVRAIDVGVPISDAYSLEAVGKHGFAIEVGPQPNGVLRADIFNMMKKTVDLTMDWIQEFNSGCTFEAGEVEVFTVVKSVDYPRDQTGEITATIHPELQDNDFKLLRRGDPVFLSFTGETVEHEGDELHPFFVNECAYYEKKIAFHLGQKTTFQLPPVCMKKN
ncbi:N-acyl-aromatic-L-amino acid amidohydrolase (carboxylate-forming) B [Nothobranchius furzeri]|uniref:N-acyl-aromatic-L-amino acid amidohydrolase n=4 Tax=Nothobranchius TaxID=28779 RepID=A0A8C6L632_NOTFU|nr:N-acyl-aromatic-L-amino acid amidohydrolase (carboxylate-forming) B [Nothobranchius furzeri]KAF7217966.1 transcript variant X2 [Nothobranchius furzeri]KAF7217967.1 transcript variant X1 [Nothobranchius furzeri]